MGISSSHPTSSLHNDRTPRPARTVTPTKLKTHHPQLSKSWRVGLLCASRVHKTDRRGGETALQSAADASGLQPPPWTTRRHRSSS